METVCAIYRGRFFVDKETSMSTVKIRMGDGYKTEIKARDLTIFSDEPLESGGTNAGLKPTELLMAALGACGAITARMYANRKGWNLEGVEIDVSYVKLKAAEIEAYQGDAEFVYDFQQLITFKGDLTEDQKTRLLEIAGRCPVHKILTSPVNITEALKEETGVIDQFEVGD
jgi:putative redox protein